MSHDITKISTNLVSVDQDKPNADNERPPGARCAACRFSFLMRQLPPSIERVLLCRKSPPIPLLGMINGRPTLLPSTHPPVSENEWCFAFEAPAISSALLKNS